MRRLDAYLAQEAVAYETAEGDFRQKIGFQQRGKRTSFVVKDVVPEAPVP
jgi:hypothetical protein